MHVEARVSAGFAGQQPAFLMPSCSCQEWSVDPRVCRLVGTDRHIKDSWFLSSWLGLWFTETVVGLEHLTPLFTHQTSGLRCLSWKAERALCRWVGDTGLSRGHFSTLGHFVTPSVEA